MNIRRSWIWTDAMSILVQEGVASKKGSHFDGGALLIFIEALAYSGKLGSFFNMAKGM